MFDQNLFNQAHAATLLEKQAVDPVLGGGLGALIGATGAPRGHRGEGALRGASRGVGIGLGSGLGLTAGALGGGALGGLVGGAGGAGLGALLHALAPSGSG